METKTAVDWTIPRPYMELWELITAQIPVWNQMLYPGIRTHVEMLGEAEKIRLDISCSRENVQTWADPEVDGDPPVEKLWYMESSLVIRMTPIEITKPVIHKKVTAAEWEARQKELNSEEGTGLIPIPDPEILFLLQVETGWVLYPYVSDTEWTTEGSVVGGAVWLSNRTVDDPFRIALENSFLLAP